MKLFVFRSGGLANQYFQSIAGIYLGKKMEKDICFLETGVKSQYKTNQTSEAIRFQHHIPAIHFPAFSFLWSALHRIANIPFLNRVLFRLGIVISTDPNDCFLDKEIGRGVWLISGLFQSDFFFNNLNHAERAPSNLPRQIPLIEPSDNDGYTLLHVRLGDYKSPSNHQGVLPIKYYADSIARLPHSATKTILVVSDEPTEALERLNVGIRNILFRPAGLPNSPLSDLSLMMNAKNLICANSSFSLMGALLNQNNAQIFLPDPFYREGKFDTNYFPEGWNTISVDY